MKILIVGLGSIGLRHLNNILQSGNHSVAVVRRSGKLPEAYSHLTVYSDLQNALSAEKFEAAFICTPTAFHTASIRHLLCAQIPNIYVEKPLSHNLNGLSELLELSQQYKCNIKVGYDLHFDPGLQKVKELLNAGVLGRVITVNAQVGQYLPDWRPHENYREGMSAKSETGGGVMLDLIHEFDYMLWLFGRVKTVACQYVHSNTLDIETEDASEVLLRFSNGIIGTIHLDYLQPKLIRNCTITCSNGTIMWNLATSSVKWTLTDKSEHEFSYLGYERNARFIEIVNTFLTNENDERLTDLKQGAESLRLVVAAKYSAQHSCFVQPESIPLG